MTTNCITVAQMASIDIAFTLTMLISPCSEHAVAIGKKMWIRSTGPWAPMIGGKFAVQKIWTLGM